MDSIELLIILIFVVLSLLEAVAGRRRKRRRSRPPEMGDEEEAWTPEGAGLEAPGDRRAEVLVPDDLWEEITGERRAGAEARAEREPAPPRAEPMTWEPHRPREEPAPRDGTTARREPARRSERAIGEEPEPGPLAAEARRRWRQEEVGARGGVARRGLGEVGRREGELPEPESLEEPARIVSLEPLEIDREAPHRLFHRRYVGEAPVGAPRGREARPGPLLRSLDLRGRASLRRAVLYREILDGPVALRPRSPEPPGGP